MTYSNKLHSLSKHRGGAAERAMSVSTSSTVGDMVRDLLPEQFLCQFNFILNNDRCQDLFEDAEQLEEFFDDGYALDSSDFFDQYCMFMAKVHDASNDLPRLAQIIESTVTYVCCELSDDMMCDHVDYLSHTNNSPVMC